jgi:hypothetical protein
LNANDVGEPVEIRDAGEFVVEDLDNTGEDSAVVD